MKTRNILALICTCLLITVYARGAAGDVDLSFDPGSKLDGAPYAVAQQPDGKLLIGGDFSTVPGAVRNRIARLNTNGTADLSFDPGSGPDNHVLAIVLQPDGKVLVGGWFTNFNGVTHPGIVRLNTDGSLDPGFSAGSGPDGIILSVALQSDGKILIGGFFSQVNGFSRGNLARLNPDGSLDTNFVAGGNDRVYSIVLQPDDKIIVGGMFTSFGETNLSGIARLNADGTVDSSFNPGTGVGYAGVSAAALQADGRIVIGGGFRNVNGTIHANIARLNSDGSVDSTFNPEAGSEVSSIVLQPDGKIILGGQFEDIDGVHLLFLARLNTDGTLDTSYNPPLNMTSPGITSLQMDTNGELLASGSFETFLARLNTDGSVDTSLSTSTGVSGLYVFMSVPQPDGNILIAGNFNSVSGQLRQGIARLLSNGQLDTTFDPGPLLNVPIFSVMRPLVYSVALQTDGKVVIGGTFTNINGFDRHNIARLNSDGSVDTNFNPGTGTDYSVYNVAIQPDGKILITGDFTTIEGATNPGFARLNSDGSLDTTFNPPPEVAPSVLMQSDGRIIAAGAFTTNGVTLDSIVRLNLDGSVDPTFASPSCDCDLVEIQPNSPAGIQADDKIIVVNTTGHIPGGPFQSSITRLNADGTQDSGFNTGEVDGFLNDTVFDRSVGVQPDGKLIVWGGFTHFNGVPLPGLVRLLINGDIDTNFNFGTGANQPIDWVSLQPDGKSLISGGFTSVSGFPRGLIARLDGGSVIPGHAPVIITQPKSQAGMMNSSATFSVAATGNPPPSYQWYHENQPLTDDVRLSGATTANLHINQLQSSDAGNYTVIVSNSVSYISSHPAALYMPPTISFPTAVTNECQLPVGIFATVTNNSDDRLTAIWKFNQVIDLPITTFSQQVSSIFDFLPFPPGTNVVTLTVSNTFGQSTSASVVVTTIDTPPYFDSASANPPNLWPPNGRMVKVTIQAGFSTYCNPATWKIVSVTSAGATIRDNNRRTLWEITGDDTVSLRADSGGAGGGRVYYITIQATDTLGTVSAPKVVPVRVGR